MKNRNTAGRLGFVKDSEGVFRKGNFIYKNGKIIRESNIVPEGTIEELKDNYTTMSECIRSVLAYPVVIGEMPRTTNVYIDKVGKGYKASEKYSKNTVAIVTSDRNVIEIKAKGITEQDDDNALKNKDKKDKPIKAKEIKGFSKPVEFDKLKKESATKKGLKLKLKESEDLDGIDIKRVENIIYGKFEGSDFFVGDIRVDNEGIDFHVMAFGSDTDEEGNTIPLEREVHFDIPNYYDSVKEACENWMSEHSSPDSFYESKK